MGVIGTTLVASVEHNANQQAMAELVALLQKTAEKTVLGGPEKNRRQHLGLGKTLPRERVEQLLDSGSPFLELGQLAPHDLHSEEELPAPGLITGIGQTSGRLAMILANDPTAEGDQESTAIVRKYLRAQEIAAKNLLPCIYLLDGDLAWINDLILSNQAKMSARGIAQIAAAFGACSVDNAYAPVMADLSIIVRDQGQITFPEALLEGLSEEDDVEQMVSKFGIFDLVAEDDAHALHLVKQTLKSIYPALAPELQGIPPRFDPEEISSFLPANPTQPVDVTEIIARIVDDSRFQMFRPLYGPTLVCGFAEIEGMLTGILAHNSSLSSAAAEKGAEFLKLCNARSIPLVILQNTTDLAAESQDRSAEFIKSGARFVAAMATTLVPKVTVLLRGTIAGGIIGCPHDSHFLWAWPETETGSKKTSGKLCVDGTIAPSDTRAVVALSLRVALNGVEARQLVARTNINLIGF